LSDGTAPRDARARSGLQIPEDVTATVGAKTLFGEKFVLLVDPAHPNGRVLRPGEQITPEQDHTAVRARPSYRGARADP